MPFWKTLTTEGKYDDGDDYLHGNNLSFVFVDFAHNQTKKLISSQKKALIGDLKNNNFLLQLKQDLKDIFF